MRCYYLPVEQHVGEDGITLTARTPGGRIFASAGGPTREQAEEHLKTFTREMLAGRVEDGLAPFSVLWFGEPSPGDLVLTDGDLDGQTPITWKPGDLGYTQFELIRRALEAEILAPAERAEALGALRQIYAVSELQGVRILALNSLVVVDEIGEPVAQAEYENLRDRAFGQDSEVRDGP